MLNTIWNLVDMHPKNISNFYRGALLLVFFFLLTFLEMHQIFGTLDPQITLALQKVIPRLYDVPLSFLSLVGSIEVTGLILALLFLWIFRQKKVLPFYLGLFAVMMVFEILGKYFLYHPAPPHYFFRYSLPFSTPEYVNTHYSFPSGHVGRTAFLVIVGLFLLRKKVSVLLLLTLLLLMMISRIYLGEHWFSDVIGGLLLGSSLGFFSMIYY